ncbi:MAG: SlyX protein [Gammaproteobacteria bacterium]|nr:MAG: SlyX protein [Gammaproteobacteria bacterium]
MLEERIVELETKLSFQEDLLQELNSHVVNQQKKIDELTVLSNQLKEQYKEIVSSLPDASAGDEVPPHY